MGRKGQSANKASHAKHVPELEARNRKHGFGTYSIPVVVLVAFAWWYRRDAISLDRLRRRLESQGGSAHCLEAGVFEYAHDLHVRGLAATCDVRYGETLLTVPRSAILSDFTADQDVIDLVDEHMGRRAAYSRDLTLAAGLLFERAQGKSSAFADYVASLPPEQDLPDNLVVWDDTQLNASALVLSDVVLWRRLVLQGLLDMVQSRPRLFGSADMQDCKWAMAIVISRQVHGRLIPILDHANHGVEPNAEIACDTRGCKMTSVRAVAKGEEVTISYGDKPNMHLLQAYGFTIRGNNISALALDASVLNVTSCGSQRIALNRGAELGLALDSEQVRCFYSAVGQCAFMKFLADGCSRLSQRLQPGESSRASYHSIAMGVPDTKKALKSLEDRTPSRPADSQLLQTLQEEMDLVERCAEKARQELERIQSTDAC